MICNSSLGLYKCRLGQLSLEPAALKSVGTKIREQSEAAAESFGDLTSDSIAVAFEKTVDRIERSSERRTLNSKNAARSLEMVRELTEGLSYIAKGEITLVSERPSSQNGRRWIVETPTNDQFEIRTRSRQDQRGQARVGIRQVSDDGVALDKRDQVDLRVDRDAKGACIDLHFLHKSLNEKVHGRIGFGKKAYPNHHFRNEIPSELNRVENFSQFVQDFENNNVANLLK